MLQALAATAGLAPSIVDADPGDRWLITELVEGTSWSDANFARRECLAVLGDTLRALHATEFHYGVLAAMESVGLFWQKRKTRQKQHPLHLTA